MQDWQELGKAGRNEENREKKLERSGVQSTLSRELSTYFVREH